jgi:hypothetical protein
MGISFVGSALVVMVVMGTPYTRRRVLAALDRLATWHEEGVREKE